MKKDSMKPRREWVKYPSDLLLQMHVDWPTLWTEKGFDASSLHGTGKLLVSYSYLSSNRSRISRNISSESIFSDGILGIYFIRPFSRNLTRFIVESISFWENISNISLHVKPTAAAFMILKIYNIFIRVYIWNIPKKFINTYDRHVKVPTCISNVYLYFLNHTTWNTSTMYLVIKNNEIYTLYHIWRELHNVDWIYAYMSGLYWIVITAQNITEEHSIPTKGLILLRIVNSALKENCMWY